MDLVDNCQMTIKEASVKVGIKYSTAKHIVKTYRSTGEIKTIQMIRRETKLAKRRDMRVSGKIDSQNGNSESMFSESDPLAN